MSETLTSIPWDKLEDAYGPASNVPALLKKIRTAKGNTLYEATDELYSRVLHQGTIYSASPPVTQILIDFSRDASTEHKAFCYGMLSGFAEAARKAIADGRAIPCHAGGDPVHGSAIRQTILAAQSAFAADVEHANTSIRSDAVRLLTAFADGEPDSARIVRNRYFAERGPEVRRVMLTGLTRTSRLQDGWADFLRSALNREDDRESRFSLRYAQVLEAGATVDDSAVEELITTFVRGFEGCDCATPVDERCFEAAALLGREREVAALLRALDLGSNQGLLLALAEHLLRVLFDDSRTGWDQTACSYVNADGSTPAGANLFRTAFRALGIPILWKLFPFLLRRHTRKQAGAKPPGIQKIEYWGLNGEAPQIPAPLNAMQRPVIEALASKEELWTFRTNLWTLFHLPDNAGQLREWLASRG
ncbi:MAG: hypothetical protein HYX27_14740 [Acidobacteria bacterium]|nr:hypothetical protein [Acidobacteriota bacterium]